VQSAAVKTIFLEIKLLPQIHKISLELSTPMTAICGNPFASAFVLSTISLHVCRAHNDVLTGCRLNVNVDGSMKSQTAFAIFAHSKEKRTLQWIKRT